ncbi:hypothetical protein AAFF_G00428270 [Aldrovandia affinis]|uniref:Uncharacterized protein n=1 Tax=Aldrovandia affinis TaxID=143900 RepID=A0AAD7S9L7_9TELE|nr:hypothetical protein AAFF_G00428270 [Aldrovandia affinis]
MEPTVVWAPGVALGEGQAAPLWPGVRSGIDLARESCSVGGELPSRLCVAVSRKTIPEPRPFPRLERCLALLGPFSNTAASESAQFIQRCTVSIKTLAFFLGRDRRLFLLLERSSPDSDLRSFCWDREPGIF